MTEYIEEITERRQLSPLVITGVVILALLLAVLLMGNRERPLKPIRYLATPVALTQNSQASLVTFDELNANPYTYQDQRIRVTGSYTPQPEPDCTDYKGLLIQWTMISSNLQLNGYGFEPVLQLVPSGTTLTVEGIWRLYDGISGCGKGAPQKLIWYLQVERIIQPNPLPNFGPLPDGEMPPPAETPPPDGAEPTPTAAEGTAVSQPTIQLTPTATTTATFTPSPTGTSTIITTTTPSSDFFTVTPIIELSTTTPGTATITATPDLTNPTATATPPPLTTPGTATATSPPLATSTPGPTPTPGSGYPGPGTAVPTVDPYP